MRNQPRRAGAVDAPHIALLLPIDSSTFRRHAEALRDGFIAASKTEGQQPLLIRVYPVGDDAKQASTTYQQAVKPERAWWWAR
jgi:outer membrane PBP1 activator LpoA protein